MPDTENACFCPYCETEMNDDHPLYCRACGVTINYCSSCQAPLPRDATTCPECGTPVK